MIRSMIWSKRLFLAALFVASSFGSASAQHAKRDRVVVTCTCDDATGQAYVTALRSALNRNPHYREVDLQEGVANNAIRINIVSMPLGTESGISKAALSVVVIHDGALLHQFVETCTRIPIQDCAESMLDDILKWTADS